jgi:type IX secretion system PorP/SprF family membrane protein
MKCRITLAGASLIAAMMFNADTAKAQDVHFTQFDATPMTINPAFTGAFTGKVRASAIYRDQWRGAMGNQAAYKTYAASIDMPLINDISVDDYLAGGLQVYNDRAGDANLNNFSVLASVAYHKYLGTSGRTVLAAGLQGGYTNKNLDLSKLYWGDEYANGAWAPGTGSQNGLLGRGFQSFIINGGLSFSQSIGERSGLAIGVGVNNVNLPIETISKQDNTADVNLKMRYTGQIGAIIGLSEAFSIRPAVLFQSQAAATELVLGSEFNLKFGSEVGLPSATGVFAGLWYRNQDAIMATAGVEFKNFRVGFAYDMNTSSLADYSGKMNGGFELMVRYVLPNPIDFGKQKLYPCGRF